MSRIRTVKPELFKHEDLYDAEEKSGLPLRLAFIGLFSKVDREGRFKWKSRTLKADILPHDNVDFSRVLDALATGGWVVRYASETGEELGYIPTFSIHQHINNREVSSTLPDPHECCILPRVEHASSTRHDLAQGEGKGKEGKGREGKGKESPPASCQATPDDTPKNIKLESNCKMIFDHWVKTMHKNSSTKFTPERKSKIKARLKDGYPIDQILSAINGCASSAWHMGKNENGKIYDDLTLICRDGSKLESFLTQQIVFTPDQKREQEVNDWINEDD